MAGMFETWAPRLFAYYDRTMAAVVGNWKDGTPPPKVVSRYLPCGTIVVNFGPQTVCNNHRDWHNLVWGWCFILILGSFDWKKGGHIVLHDLKLVLEVCPGDVVAIQSACVSHGTIPIAPGETRYSVTWYSPAGLFQWVAAGLQTMKKWREAPKPGERDPGADGEKRWLDGCRMYENMGDLKEMYA